MSTYMTHALDDVSLVTLLYIHVIMARLVQTLLSDIHFRRRRIVHSVTVTSEMIKTKVVILFATTLPCNQSIVEFSGARWSCAFGRRERGSKPPTPLRS